MAWHLTPPPSPPLPTPPPRLHPLNRPPSKNHASILGQPTSSQNLLHPCKAAQSEGITEEPSLTTDSSSRTQLDLLEQLRSSASSETGYQSDGEVRRLTIREQLSELIGDRKGEFSLQLGKKLKASIRNLTISQKRNIKRQAYLNEVGKRNDSVFFATIGAFVILPPVVILSVALLTGYVQLFP